MEIDTNTERLPPEVEKGNVEYKRYLCNLTNVRKEHLATQMNWRLNEGFLTIGRQEAVYMIGVDDDGTIPSISAEQITESIQSIKQISMLCHAQIKSTEIIPNKHGLIARVTVERSQIATCAEGSVFILGKKGAGKTTLISVIKNGTVDDGKGGLRDRLMKHQHEVKAGETSSIGYHLIGFSEEELINCRIRSVPWKTIVQRSDRVITLIDLPGNASYLNTTLFALMSHEVNFSLVLIDVMDDIRDRMNCYFLDWCIQFNRPCGIVLTKVDQVDVATLKHKFAQLNEFLAGRYGRSIRIINKEKDVEQIPVFLRSTKIPVFYVSNVTRTGVNLVINTISNLKPVDYGAVSDDDDKEFVINATIHNSEIGWILSGRVTEGVINLKDRLILGQVKGKYLDVVVQSIHHKQIPVSRLVKGSHGSLGIRLCSNSGKINITKKASLISTNLFTNFVRKFILVVEKTHDDWIKIDSQYNLYTGNQIDPFVVKYKQTTPRHTIIMGRFSISRTFRYIKNASPAIIKNHQQLTFGYIFKLHQVIGY